jgi:hypothetical protein
VLSAAKRRCCVLGRAMLKKIALVLGIVVVSFSALVASRPDVTRVERHGDVAGTPEIVFARLNNLHEFSQWSPWSKLDPEMKTELAGPASGVGSKYHWIGNDDVGEGTMEITEVRPNTVVQRLEFIRPFASKAEVTLSVVAKDNATSTVTWAMDSQNNFPSKMAGLFMNMDEMIGKDFVEGITNIGKLTAADVKAAEEAAAAKAAADAAAAAAAAAAAVPADGAAPAAPAAP